jgi:hypothetical protein
MAGGGSGFIARGAFWTHPRALSSLDYAVDGALIAAIFLEPDPRGKDPEFFG